MLNVVVNGDLTHEDHMFIIKCMQEEPGIMEIFHNKISRLYTAGVEMLLLLDDEPIGFLLALNENTQNLLFLDLGIIKKYRGKGYGTLAKEIFMKIYKGDEFIITETRNTNIGANKSSSKIGSLVYQKDDINFYLLNSSIEEFKNSPAYQEFLTHVNKDSISRKRIHE